MGGDAKAGTRPTNPGLAVGRALQRTRISSVAYGEGRYQNHD